MNLGKVVFRKPSPDLTSLLVEAIEKWLDEHDQADFKSWGVQRTAEMLNSYMFWRGTAGIQNLRDFHYRSSHSIYRGPQAVAGFTQCSKDVPFDKVHTDVSAILWRVEVDIEGKGWCLVKNGTTVARSDT